MVDLGQFLGSNYRIRWRRVAEVGVGTVFGAVFTGIASVIFGLADLPLALLSGVTDFLSSVIAVVAGLPALLLRGAFAEAAVFVLDAGLAGYIVALTIALATVYVIAEVVSRVG